MLRVTHAVRPGTAASCDASPALAPAVSGGEAARSQLATKRAGKGGGSDASTRSRVRAQSPTRAAAPAGATFLPRDGQSDAELLSRHVASDRDAFGVLFGRHRDRPWDVAFHTIGDPEEAADAVQDAVIAAFQRADSFRGDSGVTTWLHGIVVNSALDRIRRRAHSGACPSCSSPSAPVREITAGRGRLPGRWLAPLCQHPHVSVDRPGSRCRMARMAPVR
jgi:hypothetical protein